MPFLNSVADGDSADRDQGRSESGAGGGGDTLGGAHRLGVLCGVAVVAVAVFEVDAQVFDGFDGELLAYTRHDLGGERRVEAHEGRDGVESAGVPVRVADLDIKPGVTSDEGDGDEWPALRRRILDAADERLRVLAATYAPEAPSVEQLVRNGWKL